MELNIFEVILGLFTDDSTLLTSIKDILTMQQTLQDSSVQNFEGPTFLSTTKLTDYKSINK